METASALRKEYKLRADRKKRESLLKRKSSKRYDVSFSHRLEEPHKIRRRESIRFMLPIESNEGEGFLNAFAEEFEPEDILDASLEAEN